MVFFFFYLTNPIDRSAATRDILVHAEQIKRNMKTFSAVAFRYQTNTNELYLLEHSY